MKFAALEHPLVSRWVVLASEWDQHCGILTSFPATQRTCGPPRRG
ncbi:MAG: hypothetical protein ACKON9_02020 [Planctomycetaceae bacterium]